MNWIEFQIISRDLGINFLLTFTINYNIDFLCIRLTHAVVHSHTVFIIVGKVGLIVFPCGVSYRGAIKPA